MINKNILSKARQRAFDEVPKFNKVERISFFTQDKSARKVITSLRTNESKIGFLLQRAYFQAKGCFFHPNRFRQADISYAEKTIGLKKEWNADNYPAHTASHHKKLILNNYKWSAFKNTDSEMLQHRAMSHVDKQTSNEDTLFDLLDFCWAHKVEIPGYARLAEIVSSSYSIYQTELLENIDKHITSVQKSSLLSLLDDSSIVETFSELKRIDQSESQKKLNKNAKILTLFQELFTTIKPLLDQLNLTHNAIKNFSSWIYTSNHTQIKRLKNKTEVCLHLAAFVQDQFYLRQDYAVDAFIKIVRGTENQAKGFDRDERDKRDKDTQVANLAILNSAKNSHHILKLIINISSDSTLSLAERNQKVLHLAESFFDAENPDYETHLESMESNLNSDNLKISYYQHLFSCANSLQKSLSPFIRSLSFDSINSDSSLCKAIRWFVEDGLEINKDTPMEFLSDNDNQIVKINSDIPSITRYKIILFSYINNAIRNRTLTLEYSYRFRANQSYMIPENQWKRDKSKLLKEARLEKYENSKDVLESVGKRLTEAYMTVNKNYKDKKNDFITVNKKGEWRTKMPEAQFDSSKYIPSLLSKSKFKLLYELLSEVDYYAGFSERFKNRSNKNANNTIDKKMLYATLMSLGTNLGHTNMAKATKAISNKNLRDTDLLWFDSDNIDKANKCIVEVIQSLSLPTIFNAEDDSIHTSSDGKKVVVAVNSLLANYSYKYYGKQQGISVNSFIDEKQSFFHVNVLTSSDREAPYMMDGIVKTKASLFHEGDKKHKHSTDTHGYTEAIFSGLHFLDVSFAPRIVKLHRQTMYAFEAKSLRKNSKQPIAPNTVVNKKLILDNWDDILRLMTTIKLGYCSASQLFKILSASHKDNKLYQALKEFGRILKSNFILNYIDDESLRKSIHKQLNRVELGQALSKAIFFGRKGELQVGTLKEMQKVMSCKTLLKNAIILWNYFYLSDYYHSLKSKKDKAYVLECIASGSVIAWAHINMHGLYDFDQKYKKSFSATLREMKNIKIGPTID